MSRIAGNVWRERMGLWLPALIFFALNLGLLLFYQLSGMADSVNLLEQRLKSQHRQEEQLRAELEKLEDHLAKAQASQAAVRDLYRDRLSAQSIRLTRIIAELRRLAAQTGLVPDTVSYPEEEIADFGLVEKSFVFNVEGRYENLRQFITALELSESFLTLNKISLNEGDDRPGSKLRISLRLSTLFASEPPVAEEAPAASEPAAGGAEGAAP